MKIHLSLIVVICFIIAGCSFIKYQVSARTDPFFNATIAPSSFAFYSDTANLDPLIEKNIFFLINSSLTEKGWQLKSIENAEYVFSVKYGLIDKQKISSHEVGGYWDKKTKKWIQGQQQTKTDYIYETTVTIFVYRGDAEKEYVWSADCVSKGSTQDILFAAKYMVPFAISKFPEHGLWNEKEKIK